MPDPAAQEPFASLRCDLGPLWQHDLRAALADVMCGLDAALADPGGQSTHGQLERAREAANDLAQLLDLDGAKEFAPAAPSDDATSELSDASEASPAPPHLVIADALERVRRRWTSAAHVRGMSLAIHMAPDLPPVLAIDRVPLTRIFANLMRNALCYAQRGTIHLSLDFDPTKGLLLTVRDEGDGFPEERLRAPACAGQRSEPATFRNPEGQGLGLAICHALVAEAGGKIDLANAPQGGAEIRVSLPARPVDISSTMRDAPLPDLSGWNVLVADDSEMSRAVLEQFLSAMGAQVTGLRRGDSAAAQLRAERFDLAVLDVEMPGCRGPEVIASIRRSGLPWADLPIIQCSGYRDVEKGEADACLIKPVLGLQPILRALEEAGCMTTVPRVTTPPRGLLAHLRLAEKALPAGLGQELIADLETVRHGLSLALPPFDLCALQLLSHKLSAVAGVAGDHPLSRHARALDSATRHGTYEDIQDLGRVALIFIDRLIATTRNNLNAKTDLQHEN
ncbi:hybrid sensor histidine kinase/response regulator [Thioclava sediminum]|nr:ATP-binding protein [Thioclava sediminum]